MNKQTTMEKVNHEFLYHCEIQYETEHAFGYTKAVGNSIQDLLSDVDLRFKQYKGRDPKIVKAIYSPKSEKVNITAKIHSLIALRPAYSSQK